MEPCPEPTAIVKSEEMDRASLSKWLSKLEVNKSQRFTLMQLIINRDSQLIDLVDASKDVTGLLQNSCENTSDARLTEIIPVLDAFDVLSHNFSDRLMHELEVNPHNSALAEAFEVYKAICDLENLGDDLKIIANKLPDVPKISKVIKSEEANKDIKFILMLPDHEDRSVNKN